MEEAVRELGLGFLADPRSGRLQQSLQSGRLSAAEYYRQLLKLAYRVLLLLLFEGDAALLAKHLDLFCPDACIDLDNAGCGHDHLRAAVERLRGIAAACTLPAGRPARRDLTHLDSIYETLLACCPAVDLSPTPSFDLAPGPERKRTGSYYTPPELVEELIDAALGPVIERRLNAGGSREEREAALLALRICDPACGSGHFLLAAARRLALDLARVRSGNDEPPPEVYGRALSAVLARCIYGVDRDSLAVDLCLTSLWSECHDPSVLPDLSRRVRCGDSLIGVVDLKALGEAGRSVRVAELDRSACDRWTEQRLGSQAPCPIFHWPLEFPEIMESGGFDVVLTNPPWELLQPEEAAFFRMYGRHDVADLPGVGRKEAIREVCKTDPDLASRWEEYRHSIAAQSRFMRTSGRFPLTGAGRLNVYSLFMETIRAILKPSGRAGCIVPSGLITDDTTKGLFQAMVDSRELVSLRHFDNRANLFPGVGSTITFCLLTLVGSDGRCATPEYAFFLHRLEDLRDPERRIPLDRQDIRLLNPNTRTCPVFRSRRDAELVKEMYRRVPVLVEDGRAEGNGWGVELRQGLFNMTTSSHLFRSREELERDGWDLGGNVFRRSTAQQLPLYEAKMLHHYDHRWRGCASSSRTARREDPSSVELPRYWVARSEVEARLPDRWTRNWLLGCRLVCRSTDERTVIGTVLPRTACGNSVLVLYPSLDPVQSAALLIACLSSFVLDFAARQKLGGINLNFHILKQLPVLPPEIGEEAAPWCPKRSLNAWLTPRVVELIYTSWELQPFAAEMGHEGPPLVWDAERRRVLRCEIDAAFFHLYGVAREDVGYILDTFPIVKRREERRLGEYRSRRLILERYDDLQQAMEQGSCYPCLQVACQKKCRRPGARSPAGADGG